MKKVLKTPIKDEDLKGIEAGDIIYLDGYLITCRDVAHRRVIELGMDLPIDLNELAIFHAGPIMKENDDGSHSVVSVGPTTSMRMEKFEKEFIAKTGVKLIIGKGGMGKRTEEACKEHKALHCVIPGGCAVMAATKIKEVEDVKWTELGMPESLWITKVEEFGPLIVSIDAEGNNLFENNKIEFNKRKEKLLNEVYEEVRYIK